MRVAFADLNFSWPPNGGADTDLFQVISQLKQHHQVCLFALHELGSNDRGLFNARDIPFPAVRLELSRPELAPRALQRTFRETVSAWNPDVVFATHAFQLKPYLIEALAGRPVISRYYAHELCCARDPFRFKEGAHCPNDYLRTPDHCRACALAYQGPQIRRGDLNTWNTDYLAARAYAPAYHQHVLRTLRQCAALIVSNPSLAEDLNGFHENVRVIPGGVDIANFPPASLAPPETPKKIILMAGRAEDPAKGLDVLLRAGNELATSRADFEIWATHFDHTLTNNWFKALGWHDHAAAMALYPQSSVVVVPSLWQEPFGLVAVEAMAAGRPVCASRTGGLQESVRHEETGFLFTPGDSAGLARQLSLLLDDPALRQKMGEAGRSRVAAKYDWKGIIKRHYLPLIEEVTG